MTSTKAVDTALAILKTLPVGSFCGVSNGKKYIVSRSLFAKGASEKLVARELGGTDYISANVYHLTSGARLYPCEMSAEKVLDFIADLRDVSAQ